MSHTLHLFEGYGIEIEYMIVNATTLNISAAADKVLTAENGSLTESLERGAIGWSNELALHVIELKTAAPCTSLSAAHPEFVESVNRINQHLAAVGDRLMPTAMHPWMDPFSETRLWPHTYNAIYEAYNRIFDCRGHGWSNIQSVHINLPFANDDEFGRLHAAIRMVLPLIPALAASSPFAGARATGTCDTRLESYKKNQVKVPAIAGRIIPECVFSHAEYLEKILQKTYEAIRPHDASGLLEEEWLNSRGAIARFERNAIEIRLTDTQECVRADLAVASAIIAAVRAFAEGRFAPALRWREFSTERLRTILDACILHGDLAPLEDSEYIGMFGLKRSTATAGEIWRHIWHSQREVLQELAAWDDVMETILERGCLARRIRSACPPDPSRIHLKRVYGELCRCLAEDRLFLV